MILPALRFSEFSGDWEKKKLGDLCATFKSGSGITSEYINNHGNYPVYGGNGLRGYTDSFTHDGFYLLIGRQGALCGNINRSFGKAYISEHAIAVRANETSNTEWLSQKLNLLNLNRLSESSAQPGLAVNKLIKLEFEVPSLPEQTKIANFLTAVDEKISLLTQKATLLSQYKKGVMQQIFNQELRFKDDDGQEFPEWEEASIGSLFIIKAGGDIASSNVSSVKTDIYTYPIFSNSEKNLGLFGYTDEFKINTESITVTGRGTLGIAIPRYAPYYPIVRLLSLIPKLTFNVYFGASAINMLNVFIESTGVPQLTAPQISDYVISFPSLPEQNKIANFLTAVDDKITINQTQLNALKQYKQGLLQQMFV